MFSANVKCLPALQATVLADYRDAMNALLRLNEGMEALGENGDWSFLRATPFVEIAEEILRLTRTIEYRGLKAARTRSTTSKGCATVATAAKLPERSDAEVAFSP